ncbi:MarR family transcriptional regulator [Paenibacillus psychroresistens]|uniref:MarR family transcriptional regulator n=1 Tax=Paenibacillus psychroresistens TaxID=1778678 RepID=A0A6B8RGA5_9BACL|nr:MarR family transcriptional regulator [Paenibacillus psychroresistens]QGQ94396.1 MarR family transcriptional regulator [Paenibacillus psychroresistens]
MSTTLDLNHVEAYSEFMQEIGQEMKQYSECFQGSCQLNRTEFTLIDVLRRQGSMMMKDLSTYLMDVSLSTLTRLIDRLEADNYVKRSTDPKDRRCFMISLTDKAAAILEGYPKLTSELAAEMLKSLTEAEQATLMQLIQKMRPQISKSRGGIKDEAGAYKA